MVYRDVSYLGQPHKLVLSILVNSRLFQASPGSLLPLEGVCMYACIWGGNGSRGVGRLKKKDENLRPGVEQSTQENP